MNGPWKKKKTKKKKQLNKMSFQHVSLFTWSLHVKYNNNYTVSVWGSQFYFRLKTKHQCVI